MDAVLPYRAMAYNNGWANHRLLAACVRLSQADFVAPRTGFFPSLRATLNHILIIDRFYVDAMEGGTLGPAAWADPEPCETAIMLRAAQSEVDRRLIAVVERLRHGRSRSGRRHHTAAIAFSASGMDRLLLHLFQHQIHHRGQAHAMLSATGVRPPQLDEFFCRGRGAAARSGVRTSWGGPRIRSGPVELAVPAAGRPSSAAWHPAASRRWCPRAAAAGCR